MGSGDVLRRLDVVAAGESQRHFPDGFETLGGYSVPATILAINKNIAKLFPTQWANFQRL